MMALAIPYTAVLSQGIYSSLVTGISAMTLGIFSSVKSIYNHQNPDVTNSLKRLDIEYHLRLISAILSKYNQNGVQTIKEHIDNKSVIFTTVVPTELSDSTLEDPIEISLSYISKIISEIRQTLLQIDRKVVNHNMKYFSSWRTLNVEELLQTLETNTNILKNRFDDFVKLAGLCQMQNQMRNTRR